MPGAERWPVSKQTFNKNRKYYAMHSARSVIPKVFLDSTVEKKRVQIKVILDRPVIDTSSCIALLSRWIIKLQTR